MIAWLRRMFDRRQPERDLAHVIPERPDQAATLAHADALLAHPRVQALLAERDRQLRASFLRASRRLGAR